MNGIKLLFKNFDKGYLGELFNFCLQRANTTLFGLYLEPHGQYIVYLFRSLYIRDKSILQLANQSNAGGHLYQQQN